MTFSKSTEFALVYLDNVIIYSHTPEQHLEHLRIVLGLLRRNKLYVKKSKCDFAVNKIKFLGCTVTLGHYH